MEDDSEVSPWSFRSMLIFVVCAIIFIYVGKDWGSFVMPKNWTWLVGGVLVYCSGLFPYWMSKYKMPQVQADGCHGSFQHNESPVPVPDYYLVKDPSNPTKMKPVHFNWLVYGLGASMFPVPTTGKDCVLIVPQGQMNVSAKNHHSSTQVFLTPFLHLTPALQDFLTKYQSNYNIKKIYVGSKSRLYVPKDFDDADKDLQIKALNSQVGSLTKMLSGDFSGFEKVKNLMDKLNPRANWLQNVFQPQPQPQNVATT